MWFSLSVLFYLSILHVRNNKILFALLTAKAIISPRLMCKKMLYFSIVSNHHVETKPNTHTHTPATPVWCDAMRQMWQNYINIEHERTRGKVTTTKKEEWMLDVTFPSDQLTFICGPFRRCSDFRQTFFMFQYQGK